MIYGTIWDTFLIYGIYVIYGTSGSPECAAHTIRLIITACRTVYNLAVVLKYGWRVTRDVCTTHVCNLHCIAVTKFQYFHHNQLRAGNGFG